MSDVLLHTCPICGEAFQDTMSYVNLAKHLTHQHFVIRETLGLYKQYISPTVQRVGSQHKQWKCVNYRCLCGSTAEAWQEMVGHLLWFDSIERHLVDAVLDNISKVGGDEDVLPVQDVRKSIFPVPPRRPGAL